MTEFFKLRIVRQLTESLVAVFTLSESLFAQEAMSSTGVSEGITLVDVGFTLLILAGTILLFWLMHRIFPSLHAKIDQWQATFVRPLTFRSRVILSASTLSTLVVLVVKLFHLLLSLAILWYALQLTFSLYPQTEQWDLFPIARGILLTIFGAIIALTLMRTFNILFARLVQKIETWKGTVIKPVQLKTVVVLSEDRIVSWLRTSLNVLRTVVIVVIGYVYVTFVFSQFAFTKTWASTLIGYILDPLGIALRAVVNFIPNVFFILVIVVLTRYFIKLLKLIFDEVEKGTITLPGFYAEWAAPTYKIVRFVVIAFAAVMIFPYLPGSDSDAFKGISVFLGILFSLGSAGAISNIVAGVILTYMRPFRIGERVKIADTQGDVVEKTLLVTRVRTPKNVDITIPNAIVLSNHIINFSAQAKERGLILHTSVTIGYDVPWRKIHELLIAAAAASSNILKEPKPYVLQTSLNDFYVTYELNAFTDAPNAMPQTYSELHQHIQDKFYEAGVEIMSPHYSAIRDGNQAAIPQDYLPKNYAAPSFRILPSDLGKKQEPKSDQ